MGADEEGTYERLKAHFRELVDPKITVHRGRIVKNTGDGLLAEFPRTILPVVSSRRPYPAPPCLARVIPGHSWTISVLLPTVPQTRISRMSSPSSARPRWSSHHSSIL